MFTEDESLRRTRLTHFLKSYLPHAFSSSCIGHTFLNILPYVVFNPRKPTLNHYLTKTARWKFQVSIMTKHSMAWCNIAWRHPTVGLRGVNFQVKSALCRVTVSTPPSLLRRVLCISHSTISLSLCGVNVAFSSVTFWHFLLVFLFSCTSGETLSLSLYRSAPSALLTRVKLSTRQMIFTQNDLLYGCPALCCVTRYLKKKTG